MSCTCPPSATWEGLTFHDAHCPTAPAAKAEALATWDSTRIVDIPDWHMHRAELKRNGEDW